MSPYAPASDLARALAARETSSAELTEAAIARIEALDGPLNAICVKTYAHAREAAKAADERLAKSERGPLLGIPMTIKESYNFKGTPTTWGFPASRDFQPAEDALAVTRIERAGAVILGKTNVPLGLGDWQSFNDIYGVTNNPYDVTRTPGGSSGGSSAALAAGFGAFSIGSDIGGSLRVPAHFCGIFAHKPTYDLVAPRGHLPPGLAALPGTADLSVIGPMARSAEDCENLLGIMAGPDPLDAGVGYRLDLPAPRASDISGFRVLVLDRHPLSDTDAGIVEALDGLARGLEKAGAKVARRSDLLPDLESGARVFIGLLSAAMAARAPEAEYARFTDAAALVAPDDLSLSAEQMRGALLSHRAWSQLDARRKGVRAQWRALFREFDAVITPVTPTPAYPHDHEPLQIKRRLRVNGAPQEYSTGLLWAGVATMPGLPATALPIGRSQGLPIGAQIIGPWLEDRTTLMLARLIEREFGGFSPPPL